MICYWDPNNHPFKGTPIPMAERAGRQMAEDSASVWGIAFVGIDMNNARFDVDLSRSTPAKFLEWANHFNIVRCDISRGSDFLIFLGRSPVTMQVVETWQMAAIPMEMLSSLTPDEVFTAMQTIAGQCLQASNNYIDSLRDQARTNPIVAEHLNAVEHNAVAELRRAGFKVPDRDDDPLGPPKPLAPQPLTDEFSDWDQPQYVSDAAPAGWDGF